MTRMSKTGIVVASCALILVIGGYVAAGTKPATEPVTTAEAPAKGEPVKMEKAMFAAGCFWGVEAAFGKVKGIKETVVGYSGGDFKNPTYEDVCSGKTGHAEVVQIVYDPQEVSYEDLLNVFWNCHDPTTLNRQGPDVGAQYRSAIFYYTPEQKAAAEASKEKLTQSKKFKRPIVTQILPAKTFYRAEEYHQDYLAKQGLAQCH